MVVPDLRRDTQRSCRLLDNPVHTRRGQRRLLERRFRPDDDLLIRRPQREHVHRRAGRRGDAEALSLANRETMNAAVIPEDVAGFVDHDAVARGIGGVLRHECAVVVVGDEADFLAVRLVRHREPALSRVGADRVLRQIADREHRAGQLLLRQ